VRTLTANISQQHGPTVIACWPVVGVFVCRSGVAGSAILATMLILVLGIKPTLVIGIDLLHSVAAKIFALFLHQRRDGRVDPPETQAPGGEYVWECELGHGRLNALGFAAGRLGRREAAQLPRRRVALTDYCRCAGARGIASPLTNRLFILLSRGC
jgi:hypothetical protein